MKYIISLIFLLSLLPFLTVDAMSEDLHPTIEERKIENHEVRITMPTLEPANPAIQESTIRPSDQNQVINDTRNPRDEQTPRDRQAVLCDPKFGGDPSDPGCQKPQPTPYDPGDPGNGGGQGGDNNQGGNGSSSSSSSSSGEGSPTGGIVLSLPKTSSSTLPLNTFLGIICLVKGLSLTIKSLKL